MGHETPPLPAICQCRSGPAPAPRIAAAGSRSSTPSPGCSHCRGPRREVSGPVRLVTLQQHGRSLGAAGRRGRGEARRRGGRGRRAAATASHLILRRSLVQRSFARTIVNEVSDQSMVTRKYHTTPKLNRKRDSRARSSVGQLNRMASGGTLYSYGNISNIGWNAY